MPYQIDIADAQSIYPDYDFITALTPSEQKAAFHVRDASGADLCLKIIAPHFHFDRLNREVEALQTLNSPNVVQLKEYTLSSTSGQTKHHIIEEFVDGADLSATLVNGHSWTRPEVATFFKGLANGLIAVSSARIVHRDLKPSNIRVRPDGTPVIIDFGLSRHLDKPDITFTRDGAAFGTPLYFAPEQFAGTKYDIDERTDLFAVGVLMFQSLLGSHPFDTGSITLDELKDRVCNSTAYEASPEFNALPHPWQVVLKKLLAKSRANRVASATQLFAVLDKLGGI